MPRVGATFWHAWVCAHLKKNCAHASAHQIYNSKVQTTKKKKLSIPNLNEGAKVIENIENRQNYFSNELLPPLFTWRLNQK